MWHHYLISYLKVTTATMRILIFFILALTCHNGSPYTLTKDENSAKNTIFLRSLIKNHLNELGLTIIIYDDVENHIDLDEILHEAYLSCTSVSITTNEQIEHSIQESPLHFFRGVFSKIILIFFNNPLPLLEQISSIQDWNPDYIVLISLDVNLETVPIIGHDVVQRSKYILLTEQSSSNSERYELFSSKPHLVVGNMKSTKKFIGIWEGKFFLKFPSLFPERFDNFHNSEIYLSYVCDDFPFLYRSGDECIGSNLDLLEMISNNLNFTFNVKLEFGSYDFGYKLENGSWSGSLGTLFQDKNMSINTFVYIKEIIDFDYSCLYHYDGFIIVLRTPPPIPRWKTVLFPFTTPLWITFIIVTTLVMILLTLTLVFIKDSQNADTVFLLVIYLIPCH